MAPSSESNNNSMKFTENEHGNIMLEKLRSQREEGRFCDVTLYVEGKIFRAHRSVLASCSPYFDSILKMHRVVKERLTVTCQNSEVFQCLINYMYTGNVNIDKENVNEILRLANHFLVNKLKYHCEEYLEKNLELNNCLQFRLLAEKYNMIELSKNITNFIQCHIQDIVKLEEFLKYSSNHIQDFITDKTLNLSSEVLLSVICAWVHNDQSRESMFSTLLEQVCDWSTMNDEEICIHLDTQALYASNTECLLLVLRHLVQESRLPVQYQSTFQALSCKMGTQPEPSVIAPVDTPDLDQIMQDTLLANQNTQLETNGQEIPNEDQEEKSSQPVRQNSEERTKHRRKSSSVSHLWRTPAARLNALRRMQGRMQALQALSKQETSVEEEADDPQATAPCEEQPTIDGESLQCQLCDFSAPDVNQLEQHAATQHAQAVRYKCSVCGHTCTLNKQYYTHMKTHFPGPPFNCDSCEYTCDKIQLVLSHRMRHSDERPFSCPQCGFKCRTRPNLAQHQKSHTGQRPFTCEACGRSFGMKSTLEQHLATHSSDRPYLCDTCGFSTKYLSHLIAHKRIHTGEVHRCSYPHCRYSTPKKSQLGSHMRTHMGVRPHTCNTCGRGFLEKSHLVRHERIHLEDKPFKCAQCDYASSRRDKLKEHFNRHHGQNASAKVPYRPRPPRRNTNKYDEMDLLMPPVPSVIPPPITHHHHHHHTQQQQQQQQQQHQTNNTQINNYNTFEHMQEFNNTINNKPTQHDDILLHQRNQHHHTSMSQVAMMFSNNIQQAYTEHHNTVTNNQRSINNMNSLIPNNNTNNQHTGNVDYGLQPCMGLF